MKARHCLLTCLHRNTMFILCSYYAHTMLILCPYCVHTMFILCSYYLHTMFITLPAPHLVAQTFDYSLNPITADVTGGSDGGNQQMSEAIGSSNDGRRCSSGGAGLSSILGFEVQIIMEKCDCGSLRQMLDKGGAPFKDPCSGQISYEAVLATAADIAKGMAQLHAMNIVHSDCKTQNVLLKSGGGDLRGFTAKVISFLNCLPIEKVGDSNG